MKKQFIIALSLFTLTASGAIAATTNELSIEGKIVSVVAAKKEIYVSAEGKKFEFYFKDDTKLTHAEKVVPFSELSEGATVKVTYRTIGKRTEPINVELK